MESIWPANSPEGLAFTPAFKLKPGSRLIFLGLITPARDGTIRPSIAEQTRDCLSNMSDMLRKISRNAMIIKVTRLMTDVCDVWPSQQEFDNHFGTVLPTSTLLEVHSCSHPDAKIEIEAWATADSDGILQRSCSGGLFPNAVIINEDAQVLMLHVEAGESTGCSASEELAACLNEVNHLIIKSGGGFNDIVKIALYLKDMQLLDECSKFLADKYLQNAPAVVPIAKAHEAYSYQLEQSIASQTRISLANYDNILRSAGSSARDVFVTTWYLSDIREWPQVETVAKEYFNGPVPNPSVIEIPKLVLPGVRVEVDMWAALD
ncbi:hypothetical protein ZTR_10069 [Talaromyces verruculosus]|nr:hypothetical protein ZTR_10069 [Talaromyces verruculosus]